MVWGRLAVEEGDGGFLCIIIPIARLIAWMYVYTLAIVFALN